MILLSMLMAVVQPSQDTTRLTLVRAVELALERAPILESARQARAGASGARRQLASQWCPEEDQYVEYYIPGTEPTEFCDRTSRRFRLPGVPGFPGLPR